MRVLLSGASGFCGKRLGRYLEGRGLELHTFGRGVSNRENHHRINFPVDTDALTEVLRQVAPNLIFHLAGVAVAREYPDFYSINVHFAASLLRAMEKVGMTQVPVLFVGSAAEYGYVTPENMPVRESVFERPLTHYGISKLAQTHIGLSAARDGRPVAIVRPFNIIGPDMPTHLSVGNFMRQIRAILAGRVEPVINVGNLESVRDFIYVDDFAEIVYRLITDRGAHGAPVNICTGQGVKMRDLIDKMMEISGVKAEIKVKDELLKKKDMSVFTGSVDRLIGLIGRYEFTPIDESLRNVLRESATDEPDLN